MVSAGFPVLGPPWPLHCLRWVLCPVCPTHWAEPRAQGGSSCGLTCWPERRWELGLLWAAGTRPPAGPGRGGDSGPLALPPWSQCPGESDLRRVWASALGVPSWSGGAGAGRRTSPIHHSGGGLRGSPQDLRRSCPARELFACKRCQVRGCDRHAGRPARMTGIELWSPGN